MKQFKMNVMNYLKHYDNIPKNNRICDKLEGRINNNQLDNNIGDALLEKYKNKHELIYKEICYEFNHNG